ncbi:hypothetical protein ACS0TY_013247 [Phlomoides rotata]
MATVIGSSEQAILVRVRHDLLDCTFGFIHAASNYITRRSLWSFISGFRCTNLCLGLITLKLDRIFAHDSVLRHWDRVFAAVLAQAGSDHNLIVLKCVKDSSLRPRPFKFPSAWTLDTRFRELVRQSWEQPLRPPDPISRIILKLKRLKGVLRV